MTADNGAFCLNTKHKQHTDFTVQEKKREREGGRFTRRVYLLFLLFLHTITKSTVTQTYREQERKEKEEPLRSKTTTEEDKETSKRFVVFNFNLWQYIVQLRTTPRREMKSLTGTLFVLVVVALTATPSSNAEYTGRRSVPKGRAATTGPAIDLLDRLLGPDAKSHFDLGFFGPAAPCSGYCYTLQDSASAPNTVVIRATSISELTAGIGFYLREYCNMTIGWKRGGGSNLKVPASAWAKIGSGDVVLRKRNVPWSYMMNVCTHSYSLVWYSWQDWEHFIDWMALSGINLVLATTGQEEVQYKVFSKLGMSDLDIRSWFNGPAFLTWSRGQNEYGNDIAGPLPRSWMKAQWNLQKQILGRERELGIVGQLPGFQGNVPIQIKTLLKDSNITKQGDTGWMDSLDPTFLKIAKLWMEQITEDFGTDHWYQLDGYFNGGTAPWMENAMGEKPSSPTENMIQGGFEDVDHDVMAYRRGQKAFEGLNQTDPDAIWSFQGWAFIGWNTPDKAAFMKGFVDAVPKGRFVIIDMSTNGEGEWKKWNHSSFWGAPFIWTTLHDFGGTDGMKGNLSQINEIPYAAMAPEEKTSVWGTGFTPEGIDQNPVYYEFMIEQNFRAQRVADIPQNCAERAMKRYVLQSPTSAAATAAKASWTLLCESAYTDDIDVQDHSGVPHLPASYTEFAADRRTPNEKLCKEFKAWEQLISAGLNGGKDLLGMEPFSYDLVNLGQEILTQLSSPMSMNFSDALAAGKLDGDLLKRTGNLYVDVLEDIDQLVGTDSGFLLGSWLEMARYWASPAGGPVATDCAAQNFPIIGSDCKKFYEWNARVQLTTWNPTAKDDSKIPGGPIDYASKHWNGLIKDYYGKRAQLLLEMALNDAGKGVPTDQGAVDKILAQHAYQWTTDFATVYPSTPVGDFMSTSKAMLEKYKGYFTSCT
jgi:alpha-N-acetylglucosaminidase